MQGVQPNWLEKGLIWYENDKMADASRFELHQYMHLQLLQTTTDNCYQYLLQKYCVSATETLKLSV